MTKSVNRVQGLRESRNWHRTVIAAPFNASERTVRRWENGEVDVPSDVIPQLAQMFDVSPECLMGWDPVPAGATGGASSFEAKERAAGFLQQAAVTGDARDAASWSNAARNAVEVALKCEQIVATKAKR